LAISRSARLHDFYLRPSGVSFRRWGAGPRSLASAHAFGRPPGIDALIYSHVTPYGTFRLDMNERLVIETDMSPEIDSYFAVGDSVVGFRPDRYTQKVMYNNS
jgi:hypothetical protein